jgi:nucleoside-diphosphate-sugar epimerase
MNLIVGGTGFIGGHLAEFFLERGEISKGTFRKGSYLRTMDQCGVQCIEADILDRSSLHEPLEGVETVYNLASPTPKDGAGEDYLRANTDGVRNLFEEAMEHGVKAFVHLSTMDVYGFGKHISIDERTTPAPNHPYHRAKLAADQFLLDIARNNPEMKVRIVRAARAVGARDRTLILPILRMAATGRVILPKDEQLASFSHPKDIAQALLNAANSASENVLCLVKSFDSTASELVDAILESFGRKVEVRNQGLFSGKTLLSSYVANQLKTGLHLQEQSSSWAVMGYTPSYSLEKVKDEVAQWCKREPWIIEQN